MPSAFGSGADTGAAAIGVIGAACAVGFLASATGFSGNAFTVGSGRTGGRGFSSATGFATGNGAASEVVTTTGIGRIVVASRITGVEEGEETATGPALATGVGAGVCGAANVAGAGAGFAATGAIGAEIGTAATGVTGAEDANKGAEGAELSGSLK